MTTFSSYGQVAERRQAEIIRSLGREKPSSDRDGNLVREIAKLVARHKGDATSVATDFTDATGANGPMLSPPSPNF
jgi:hypothetical protein